MRRTCVDFFSLLLLLCVFINPPASDVSDLTSVSLCCAASGDWLSSFLGFSCCVCGCISWFVSQWFGSQRSPVLLSLPALIPALMVGFWFLPFPDGLKEPDQEVGQYWYEKQCFDLWPLTFDLWPLTFDLWQIKQFNSLGLPVSLMMMS